LGNIFNQKYKPVKYPAIKKIVIMTNLYNVMTKILLFIFSIQPLLSCFIITIMALNSCKITESLSYLSLLVAMGHYLVMGLKEVLKEK
jgi:hypothetical protein